MIRTPYVLQYSSHNSIIKILTRVLSPNRDLYVFNMFACLTDVTFFNDFNIFPCFNFKLFLHYRVQTNFYHTVLYSRDHKGLGMAQERTSSLTVLVR